MRAVDQAAVPNVGPPVEIEVTVIGEPIVTIDVAPTNPSFETTARFEFSSNVPATYTCSLDDALPTSCTSPVNYSEADLKAHLLGDPEATALGGHSFEIVATNAYGVQSVTTYDWEIVLPPDNTAPTTTISGPTSIALGQPATFVLSGTDNQSLPEELTFECALGTDALASCSSPHVIAGLAAGEYTLRAVATDAADNTDLTAATHTFTVVAPPPDNTLVGDNVTVDLTLPGDVSVGTITFANVSVDGYTTIEALATPPALPAGYLTDGAVYYDISTTATYNTPITLCLSYPATVADPVRLLHHDGTTWVDVTTSNDTGALVVCTEIVDSLSPFGIVTATDSLVADTTLTQTPPAVSGSADATFDFTSSEPGLNVAPNFVQPEFECAEIHPDTPAIDPLSWGSCEPPYLLDSLLLGEHTFMVRAVHTVSGLADGSPEVYTWTIEEPSTTINQKPPLSTLSTNASFTFGSNDPMAEFECSLDGALYGSCDTPYLLSGLGIGQHELDVRAKSSSGVVDPDRGELHLDDPGARDDDHEGPGERHGQPHRSLRVLVRPRDGHLRVQARQRPLLGLRVAAGVRRRQPDARNAHPLRPRPERRQRRRPDPGGAHVDDRVPARHVRSSLPLPPTSTNDDRRRPSGTRPTRPAPPSSARSTTASTRRPSSRATSSAPS